jgi:heptosyltransferase III
MNSLSVIIITYNEERNIERCLQSILPVADDIVVVDSFSTDRTVELSRKFPVRFFTHPFDNYVEQKNWALQQALYPHVLSVDADEVLSEELIITIKQIKESWNCDGYYLNRLTNYCGQWIRYGGWYPDKKLRLWDSRKGKWAGIKIHEKVVLSDNCTIGALKGDLLHYSYHSFQQHVQQANKFTDITAEEAFERGKHYPVFLVLLKPTWKFIRDYIVKLGFLDGFYGLVIAVISAYATFLKCVKTNYLVSKQKDKSPKRIIVSRVDNLGDVILTLPVAGVLKELYPEAKIYFLGKSYTKPIIEASQYVDNLINWDELQDLPFVKRLEAFNALQVDMIVHVFPNYDIARLSYHANISVRIGTSHRLYNWIFCNKRINLGRKNSPLHEAQLNLKLIERLSAADHLELRKIPQYYGLNKIEKLEAPVRELIDKDRFNLILHPKSKGSAREWGMSNFDKLISLLPEQRYKIFITGNASEGELIRDFIEEHSNRVVDLTGKLSLSQLMAFINEADGLVAASTGPLHIASALGKVAIGLFAPMKPIHPGRWSPIGPKASYLVIDKVCNDCRNGSECHCIKSITPEMVMGKLKEFQVKLAFV